jgi:hypothetical protein
MDQAARGRIEQQIDREARKRFPGAVRRVAVLQHGDDPVVEPGELLVRVIIDAPEGQGHEAQQQALDAFDQAHRRAIGQFRDDLPAQLRATGRLEFRTSETSDCPLMILEACAPTGGDLTAVMARLGPADLETLDALISAGIAASRAEAVRWALARIRERPAYAQLRERAREIERLKTEF